MPIVEVRALPQPSTVSIPSVLARICTDLAKAIDCPVRQVWATWATLPPGTYAEADSAPELQPRDTHPPMARILAMEGRDAAYITAMLESVSKSLAATLPIDEDNTFVRYEELRRGRVAWGGKVRT